MKKLLFISSTGGHLTELMQLKELFSKYPYHIITEKTDSTKSYQEKYKGHVNYLVYGTKHHLLSYCFKFPYNCIKSLFLYFKIRPTHIITTGAHTAVPMCYIGRLFGSKVIYIETLANIKTKTLSGKLVYPIANLFLVQWESMLNLYPRAKYIGPLF